MIRAPVLLLALSVGALAAESLLETTCVFPSMVVLPDRTVAFVYGRADQGTTHYWDGLHFARFNLEWLTDGRGSFAPHISP